ncbi:B-box type zinc finger protein-like [Tropilaelaps mercedesae]|uniref:B-box type zinc finger protein-like n=1 Tax=Tropilaelaps mercedesae TaxID=418985 RepID=A0A1V9XK90_9ACAR|nr:B-box type zinc finger protein-like [Tropilaelaps mercedesae]
MDTVDMCVPFADVVKLSLGGSPSMGSNACSSPNTHSPSSSLTGTPTFGSGDSPPALESVLPLPSCPSLGPLGPPPLGPAAQNGSGNAGGQPTESTKCGLCHDTFTIPKVLSCLHTFCQPCLEKVQECPEKMKCPQCGVETALPGAGVVGLLSDYAISNMLESAALDSGSPSCTSCKSKESGAIARCFDCANFLCPNCVMAHQFMHCFEGHRVMTLGELQSSKDAQAGGDSSCKSDKPVSCLRHKNEPLKFFCHTCNLPICKECTLLDHPKGLHDFDLLVEVAPKHVEGLVHLIDEGRSKSHDLKTQLKNTEQGQQRLQMAYQKAQSEVSDTFQFYRSMIEERRQETLKELENIYNAKVLALGMLQKNVQETVDKIVRVTEFVERLTKFSSHTEVMVFKQLLDTKFQNILTYQPDMNSAMQNMDLEFVSNFQAIQVGVRNTFGYIKQGLETTQPPTSGGSVCNGSGPPGVTGSVNMSSVASTPLQQKPLAPIGRPTGGVIGAERLLNSHAMTLSSSLISAVSPSPSIYSSAMNPGNNPTNMGSMGSMASMGSMSGLSGGSLSSSIASSNPGGLPSIPSIFDSSTLTKRLSSASSLGPFSTSLDINPYEKWSTGGCGDIFSGSCAPGIVSPADFSLTPDPPMGVGVGVGVSAPMGVGVPPPTAPANVDLSSKFVSPSIYPLKSQLKRQKMIYHCKFGEFGVMEGQFTEPSGVAVNAQNDIIVADTNNHRIQIFDKEGRFKFQFGECGKRDGQLLYPNRVSVVKTSGDIIVTERSPTHQIQVYNQYGQFVRKFGANILQHPRGITVDNKGRIIVVECKVMRVLIFDHVGSVLQKFGVCINQQGEILVADNHNNFNITIFTQDGQLVNALESKVKHAQCFDVALMDDGSVVLASKDYRLYIYRYIQVPALAL